MGMEPFLIASSLLGIVAQRLVRTLCKECAEPYEPDDVVLEQLGITREQLGGRLFYKAVGCHSCLETGYSGRCGVHEILVTNDEIRALIIKNVDAMTIKRAAMKSGLKTLRESGLDLVLEGKSSVDEVLSLTQEDIARDSIT